MAVLGNIILFGLGNKPLDLTFAGYTYGHRTYAGANKLYKPTQTSLHQPCKIILSQYYHSESGNLVLKFGPVNRYCNGFTVSFQGYYQNARDGLGQYQVICTAEDRTL
eukprot:COSAG01_NODE_13819_length_1530_cov_3.316562_3_plen_108_part_00